MKKLLCLSAMLGLLVFALAPAALAQNPYGTLTDQDISDEGNLEELCAAQGQVVAGRGCVDSPVPQYNPVPAPVPGSPECPNTRVTPDGLQCSDLPDVTPQTVQYGPTEPCPLGLDQFPEGTVCGEGGGYVVPDDAAPTAPVGETPAATTTTTATSGTTVLPYTGGPSLVLLAGTLLVGAGLVLRRR